MDDHCRGCIRYLRGCSGLSKAICEKYQLRILRTNADRIRAMTDEELAKLIHDIVQAEMWRVQVRECITTDDGWLDWLKQEAEE